MKNQLGEEDIFMRHWTDVQEQNTIEPNKYHVPF